MYCKMYLFLLYLNDDCVIYNIIVSYFLSPEELHCPIGFPVGKSRSFPSYCELVIGKDLWASSFICYISQATEYIASSSITVLYTTWLIS